MNVGEIEHARVTDDEIPKQLFELDTKIEKIANEFQRLTFDNSQYMIQKIGASLNKDLHKYVPNLMTQLDKL